MTMIELRANYSDEEQVDEQETLYVTAAEGTPDLYPNLSFIGASACFEQVCSMAQRIATKDLCSTYPKMLEAFLFLKFKSGLWDKYDVKNKRVQKLIRGLLAKQYLMSDRWILLEITMIIAMSEYNTHPKFLNFIIVYTIYTYCRTENIYHYAIQLTTKEYCYS